MVKNIFKIIVVFVIGIVGGIFANQILWPYFVERPLFLKYRLKQSPVYITEKNQTFIQENTALQDAVEKVNDVVVGIRTETENKGVIDGSGMIVTSDGLVVTLSNFFPKDSKTDLFFEGKMLAPKVIQIKDGLALLKIEGKDFPTVGFADSEKIKLGERVFPVGALFEKTSCRKIINEGIIKIFNKDTIYTNISDKEILGGSPLFDIEGNVLGLNTFNKEGRVTAIRISKIKKFLGF